MDKVICIIKILAHKFFLLKRIIKFCASLLWRALVHDLSKFSSFEFKMFSNSIKDLNKSNYGSKEYQGLLDNLGVALDHHYKVNSHHPQYYQDGINDMTLYDVVEMYFDWEVAVKKHKDGNVLKSLEINRKRFKISNQLCRVLKNTYMRGNY